MEQVMRHLVSSGWGFFPDASISNSSVARYPIYQRKLHLRPRLTAVLQRVLFVSVLASGAVVGLGNNHAFALNECSIGPAGPVVTCDDTSKNPYAGGITYIPLPGTLNVESGVVVNRSSGTDLRGIRVRNLSGTPLAVNLADGVIITTNGLRTRGLEVEGIGDVVIDSGADIWTVGDSSTGLFGTISSAASAGNINISQLENSTVTVAGAAVTGVYGLNEGTGSTTVSSAGVVSTVGDSGFGIFAQNSNAASGNTTVILDVSGSVLTDGVGSAGLYSLNEGSGDALAFTYGKITLMQRDSDGVVVDVDRVTSSGDAIAVLSNTADISTTGDRSRGVYALNWGLGQADITSAGVITTDGAEAYGLQAKVGYDALRRLTYSAADVLVSLESGGSIVTKGASAYGIFTENEGVGASTVDMGSGTSITTSGTLANGVNGVGGGPMSFAQAAASMVAVSGDQSFGVNLVGVNQASADIDGSVSSAGEFGVGVSSFASAGPADIVIGANSTVSGGWQTDVAGLGASTVRPSAGMLLGSSVSSQLTNFGVIGAASDRAIADSGRQAATIGNLTVSNSGLVTGFMDLATGGTNTFYNNASGVFDVRHFADTDGDGVRDTKRVSISDFGAATSSFNNLSGATVRLAPVVGEANADGANYYIPTTGIDSRSLEATYYTLDRSGVVQGQFTNLGTFHNAGVVDLRGTITGNTLVVTGNASAGGAAGNGVFISEGGQLLLNTVLNEGIAAGGQTGSFSDVLVVDGTQMGTGATTITIDRREGAGALTPGNGILLVEVRNKAASAPDVFALNGDAVVNGEQTLIAGANSYNLFHNGVASDSTDGNWYLRNVGFAPSVPAYEDYPKVLLSLIKIPTLQQRVGNRYWNDERGNYDVNPDGTAIIENSGIWGRIEGAHGRYEPSVSTSGARYDADTWKMQAGLDGLFVEDDRGKLIGGVMAHYGQAAADVMAGGSSGDINADGYGLGATLTWYGIDGFYVDTQAQATWFDSDLSSSTLGRNLIDGNKGFGYAFSLEAGQRVAMDQKWTLIPQAQLIYSDIRFDGFTDSFGSTVSLSDGDSLRGRLGLAAERQERWKEEDGSISRVTGYGIANLYNEFQGGTRVNVSGTELASRDDRLWSGLGFGGSYNWNDDKYSIYGEAAANTGLSHFGRSFDVGGTVGFRAKL